MGIRSSISSTNDKINGAKVEVTVEELILKSKKIALKHDSNFVGTEHLLLASLIYIKQLTSWLKQNGASKNKITSLKNVLKKIVKTTTQTKTDAEYQCDYKHNKMKNVESSFSIDSTMISPCLSKTIGVIYAAQMCNIEELFVKVFLGIMMAHNERHNAGGLALLHVFAKENTFTFSILNKLPISINQMSIVRSNIKTFDHHNTFSWSETIPAAAAGSSLNYNTMINTNPMSLDHKWPESPVPGETHWVIPGRILVGASPSIMNQSEIMTLVVSGIDTFVNLQTTYFEYVTQDYRNILRSISKLSSSMFPPHELRFLHCPIGDHDTLPDNEMVEFVEELGNILEIDHRNVYIHCYGGHGRTGMVLVNLLQYLFGIDKSAAMQTLRSSHKQRKCIKSNILSWCSFERGQLENSLQETQVIRLENIMFHRQLEIRKLQKSINTDILLN